MTDKATVEIWRGDFLESTHEVHAVVCGANGEIEAAWGDPGRITLPRSSAKMIQALPLLNSGAARAARLTSEHLALACASHAGAAMHTSRVTQWLGALDLDESALLRGAHSPSDQAARVDLVRSAENPDQRHNNCSGKHTGFLTLCKHLKAGLDYIDPDHPVQRAVRTAVEETTQETVSGFAIDGCSAPNFACSLAGLARAMAHFANAPADSAEAELAAAMVAHPLLVAGHGKSTAELMEACNGGAAVKTGAEGVYVGILPGLAKGFAVKATCGDRKSVV